MTTNSIHVALALWLMIAVAVTSFTLSRRSRAVSAQVLLKALGLLSIIFIVGLTQNIAIRESFDGRIPLDVGEFFMTWGQLILALTAQGVMISILVIRHRHRPQVIAELTFLNTAISDFPSSKPLEEYGLTARELDVLAAMFHCALTDAELGEALYISRATAATHVRNILRKTELHHRRDLLLLPEPTAKAAS